MADVPASPGSEEAGNTVPSTAQDHTPGSNGAVSGSEGGGEGGGGNTPAGGAGGGEWDGGNIADLNIERELQDSYLTYAMSTIMDRALPDVRDGLKPSQRRILVAMNDLGLRPGKKHLKCAKIAGDTSGNYHPHGESVIYPTLVGLAQKWRMRSPLIDPQGNFGSIDGDPPAAMRYTEARLMAPALDMLEDLKLGTVDFQPNYDDRLTEPTVLPGKFPNLLINGGIGIAVGMATSLAPHNPEEIFDSITRVLDNPEITLPELMEDETEGEGDDAKVVRKGIKGPDFPTGGLILGKAGIVESYATGRGKVTVRGLVHTEEVGTRTSLVIDSIPYSLVQQTLVESIVESVKEERIKDISDVRNESGREAQTRIVIELKRGADPAVVENQLYQHTPLQQTFSMHNIALVNRQPRTLSLLEMIRYYIEHRVEVIVRRTAHLLGEAKKRAHVLEGMIFAVCDIDEVIALIRSCRTRAEAVDKLSARRFRIAGDHEHAGMIPDRMMRQVRAADDAGGVLLTRVQAEQICNMRLAQLTGLEIERLVDEYRKIAEQIEEYESILASRERQEGIVRDDCVDMKTRYCTGKAGTEGFRGGVRLTEIQEGAGDINIAALIQEEDVAVTISNAGYAKRVALTTYKQQGRGGKGVIGAKSKDEDFISHMFVASTHDDLLCFTNTGRVFKIKVYELPDMPRTARGRPIVNLLELKEGERVRAFLDINDFESGSHFLTFVSRGGVVKRTALKEYRNVHKGGLIAVGLREGDSILSVTLTGGKDDLLLATAKGMSIRFNEQDARLMGRSAAGVKGIDLAPDDEVVGVVRIPMFEDDEGDLVTHDQTMRLLTVSANGYGKRTPIDEYRVHPETGKPRSQSRGGKGRVDINASARNGRSVASLGVWDTDDVVVSTKNGMVVRMSVEQIRETGRGSQGVRVVKMGAGDEVVAVARVEGEE